MSVFASVAVLLTMAFPTEADVYINEVLSSNDHGLRDNFYSREDWIELYNSGAEPVSLEGWWLSDKPKKPEK